MNCKQKHHVNESDAANVHFLEYVAPAFDVTVLLLYGSNPIKRTGAFKERKALFRAKGKINQLLSKYFQ